MQQMPKLAEVPAPSLAKTVYDVGATMRKLNTVAQEGAFDGQKLDREAVRKLQQSAKDLCAWLYRYTD